MNTSPVKESLPELPEPTYPAWGYDADDLREYGRLCALQAIAAPREGWVQLSEIDVNELWRWWNECEGDQGRELMNRILEAGDRRAAAPLAVNAPKEPK